MSKDELLSLYAHQAEGVSWMLAREECSVCPGGLLCDGVGVGKTPQVVATLIEHPLPATLIVAPVNILVQWENQLHRWAPKHRVILYHGPNRPTTIGELFAKARLSVDLNGDSSPPQRKRKRKRKRRRKEEAPPVIVITSYSMLIDREFEARKRRLDRMGMWPKEMQQATGQTLLHEIIWDRVVLDECHEIRNHGTLRARYAIKLQAHIRWGLTATPVHNGLQDYYSLLMFLGFSNWEIMQIYATHPALKGRLPAKTRTLLEQPTIDLENRRIYDPNNPDIRHKDIILRRKKDQVFSDKWGETAHLRRPVRQLSLTTRQTTESDEVPRLHVHIVRLDFDTPMERDFYRALEHNTVLRVAEIVDQQGNEMVYAQIMFELLLRLRQCSIHPELVLSGYRRKFNGHVPRGLPTHWMTKADEPIVPPKTTFHPLPTKIAALCRLIQAHRGEKAIVFCEFREEMPFIQRALKHHVNVRAATYDGTMSIRKRQALVRAMQWDYDAIFDICREWTALEIELPQAVLEHIASYVTYDVILIQTDSGNAGLNMQMCSRVYFTNPNWNPCLQTQGIGRAHRIGQTRTVHAYVLALHDTQVYHHDTDADNNELVRRSTVDQRVLNVQARKRAIMADVLDDPSLADSGCDRYLNDIGGLSLTEIRSLLLDV